MKTERFAEYRPVNWRKIAISNNVGSVKQFYFLNVRAILSFIDGGILSSVSTVYALCELVSMKLLTLLHAFALTKF